MTEKVDPRPDRLLMIVGVPRSGTSVLHALLSTAPGTSDYAGEASYLRLMLGAHRQANGLFEQHTRYVFPTRDKLKTFHKGLMDQVISAYAVASGCPETLILKDPLLTPRMAELADMIDRIEFILILRHPADVIASRLAVQDRLGVQRDPDRLILEHNQLLEAVILDWDQARPSVVTYPMLAERQLDRLRMQISLKGIDLSKLWLEARKRYPEDGQPIWMTPLYGQPLRCNNDGRNTLDHGLAAEIDSACLPICLKILSLGGIRASPYWRPVLQNGQNSAKEKISITECKTSIG